jgi:excisionase family DNA binding protein
MTPEQVASYLQVHPATVYRLIREHKLTAARIGRTYRIPREEVESFLLAQSSKPMVRRALFRRALSIAERNPGVSSDEILEELEVDDEERKGARAQRG